MERGRQRYSYTQSDFDGVFAYIQQHAGKNESRCIVSAGFEVSVMDHDTLSFKKNGYSLGVITRNGGVIALAKNEHDNKQNMGAILNAFKELVKDVIY